MPIIREQFMREMIFLKNLLVCGAEGIHERISVMEERGNECRSRVGTNQSNKSYHLYALFNLILSTSL